MRLISPTRYFNYPVSELTIVPEWLRFGRNALGSLAGAAFSQGSSLVAAVITARMLDLAGFGQLGLIQTTVILMCTLGDMGLTLTTTKFVSRWRVSDPKRAGQLIGWSLRTITISALLMATAIVLVNPSVEVTSLEGLSREIWVAWVLTVFEMFNKIQFGALAGLEAFENAATIHLCRGCLMIPCVWLGVWSNGLLGAVAAMAVVSFLTCVVGYCVLKAKCKALEIPIRYDGGFAKDVLSTSTSLWFSTLMLAGSAWVVTIVLSGNSSGLAELALYNAADRWKTVILFLPQTVFQVSMPMLCYSNAKGDRQACKRIVSVAIISTAVVSGVSALAVMFMSHWLMSMYGSNFAAGSNVLALAAAVAFTGAMYATGSSVLWALGSPVQMLAIDIGKTGILLGLCWAGYAVTAWNLMFLYLLALSAGSIAVLFSVRKHLKTPIPEPVHADALL
jgi:O-antigen/teichoic acid export membrane protein